MANFRQNTLTQLATDLVKIKVSNSYNTNLHERIVKGYIALSDVTQFPQMFYLLGGEAVQGVNESDTMINWECDIIIGVHFTVNSDFNNAGILTDEYEKIISDIKDFLHGGQTNKFEWHLILNKQSEKTASRLLIETVEPFVDYKTNKGTVLIMAKINYWENV